jgi:hypothetical protein
VPDNSTIITIITITTTIIIIIIIIITQLNSILYFNMLTHSYKS